MICETEFKEKQYEHYYRNSLEREEFQGLKMGYGQCLTKTVSVTTTRRQNTHVTRTTQVRRPMRNNSLEVLCEDPELDNCRERVLRRYWKSLTRCTSEVSYYIQNFLLVSRVLWLYEKMLFPEQQHTDIRLRCWIGYL